MNPTLTLFALAVVVLCSLWLEHNVKVFAKLGAAATAIMVAMVLSNLGVIPGASPVYDFLMGPLVLAGIVLILLSVNVRSIRDAGTPMLVAFVIGAVGTGVGAFAMGIALGSSIGADAWKLSGQFTGTYVGGGMNFVAIGQELGTAPDLFSAGIAADVIITAVWLVACLVIPEILDRRAGIRSDTSATDAAAADPSSMLAQLSSSVNAMTLTDFAGLATIALGVMWFSDLLAGWLPMVPKVLWLTTLALALAQLRFVRRLNGAVVLGHSLLLLFLAGNGAKSVIARIVEVGPAIFYFAAGVVAIHGIIIFGVGRLLRMNGDLLSIASQANIGGSTTAMALAGARRRPDLILPGVAVGMLGSAAGNYAGIAVAFLVRSWGA